MAQALTPAAAAPARASEQLGEHALAERALKIARVTALGVLGDPDRAKDVAQEVALIALRRRASLRDPGALDAWLHRIAVHAALREARTAGRRRQAEEQAAQAAPPPTHAGEPLGGSLALLEGLPSRQRAALTLRYVHDLDDHAIARALRCRTGTVRSLLSRGREALRGALQDQTHEENR